MKLHTLFATTLLTLCLGATAYAKDKDKNLRLPLCVHIVTGVDMIREPKSAKPTVMNMPVTIADGEAIMKQVNEIWAPAGIEWVTDPDERGGGIVIDKAGGRKRSAKELEELAKLVVAREREEDTDCMTKVFPALADPSNNDSIKPDGTRGKARKPIYHLYLFPYVGQTLQGTANRPGTFAVVGVFSDKSPNKEGLPKQRPFIIPAKTQPVLSPKNFPKDGALSATIAHELGHNLNLTHEADGMDDNLMKGHVKLRLSQRQIDIAHTQAEKGPLVR